MCGKSYIEVNASKAVVELMLYSEAASLAAAAFSWVSSQNSKIV